jgi:anti-sigma factor RsiW
VDERKLQRFLDGQLSAEEAAEVSHLVTSFRAWYDALARVLRDRPPES